MRDGSGARDCSEATAREVDEEVRDLMQACFQDAHAILTRHRNVLEEVVRALLERESLDRRAFEEIAGGGRERVGSSLEPVGDSRPPGAPGARRGAR
jgi:cell division protease FtsH